MTWADMLWLPPVMLAVAVVLGSTGRRGARSIARGIVHTFVALTLGVLLVGAVLHVVARVFA